MRDAFIYTTRPALLGGAGTRLATLPAGLTERDALFDALNSALGLPGWFGRNWDALSDVLSDLSWLSEPRVILAHADLPDLAPDSLGVYLEVLADAVESWAGDPQRAFIVCFPPELRDRIGALGTC